MLDESALWSPAAAVGVQSLRERPERCLGGLPTPGAHGYALVA